MLTVKLFAKARDLVGSSEIQIPWSDGQTVADGVTAGPRKWEARYSGPFER